MIGSDQTTCTLTHRVSQELRRLIVFEGLLAYMYMLYIHQRSFSSIHVVDMGTELYCISMFVNLSI